MTAKTHAGTMFISRKYSYDKSNPNLDYLINEIKLSSPYISAKQHDYLLNLVRSNLSSAQAKNIICAVSGDKFDAVFEGNIQSIQSCINSLQQALPVLDLTSVKIPNIYTDDFTQYNGKEFDIFAKEKF